MCEEGASVKNKHMHQKISETVSVIGLYSRAQFIPKKFLWKKRVYQVEQVTCITNIRDGAVRKRMYSVTSLGNVYRLMFNREEETWELAEVWYD